MNQSILGMGIRIKSIDISIVGGGKISNNAISDKKYRYYDISILIARKFKNAPEFKIRSGICALSDILIKETYN